MKTRRIPFDINKAKSGAKVVTRAGYSVRIGFFDAKSNKYPIIAAVDTGGGECPYSFTEQGRSVYGADENEYNELDLFIEEEEEETDDYNPYKATVESIADMVERYADANSDLKDFYNQVRVRCKEAVEYEKKWNKEQGEQKTADSLEISPDKWYVCTLGWESRGWDNDWKFVEGFTYPGSEILQCYPMDKKEIQNHFRLWTIKDTKVGDILVNGSNIFIIHYLHDKYIVSSCHVNINDGKFYDDSNKHFCIGSTDEVVTLATKEQCNFLVQKMKKAGYKWDNKYKELKKIDKEDKELKQINKEVKTRLMTNQELSDWLCQCPEECREFKYKACSTVLKVHVYYEEKANDPAEYILIRKNHGEWKEPLIEI